MLEAEDDEDVACTVEDTEAIGRSRSLGQRDGRKGGQSTRTEMMTLSSGALCRPRGERYSESKRLRHHLFQAPRIYKPTRSAEQA